MHLGLRKAHWFSTSECVDEMALWGWDFAEGEAAGRGHGAEDAVSRHLGDWPEDGEFA